ncbi:hypothetical protein [Streptomyces tendae]
MRAWGLTASSLFADKVHGPADSEAVAAKRARLTGGATNAGAAA